MMSIIAQVHLLPADKKTVRDPVLFISRNGLLGYGPSAYCQPQNLYFTIPIIDRVNYGDWTIPPMFAAPFQWLQPANVEFNRINATKVVATTDTELQSLPKIPMTFIRDYIEYYNEERLITEVELETDTYPIDTNGNLIGTNKPYPYTGLKCNFTIKEIVKRDRDGFCLPRIIQKKTYTEIDVMRILEDYDREFKIDTLAYTQPADYTPSEWFNKKYKK